MQPASGISCNTRQNPTNTHNSHRLARVLQANAYADVWQDLPSATTRGEAPRSIAGVFPLFSFANHSCCPNAAHSVIGSTRPAGGSAANSSGGGVGGGSSLLDVLSRPGVGPRMVLRAALRINPGEEVTVNYLGRGVLAPAEQRRGELAGNWGFECRCALAGVTGNGRARSSI